MADLKISQLTGATTPLAGTEVLPVVQSGSTKKVSVADLTAGRNVAAKSAILTQTSGGSGGFKIAAELLATDYPAARFLNTTANDGFLFGWDTDHVVIATNTTDGVAGIERVYIYKTSGDVKLVTGNLVQGTAAKGINFTANTPAAGKTSQLLNWYEEGTWTPTITFGGGSTGITYAVNSGTYTRIGRLVTGRFIIVLSNKGSSTGDVDIVGLPFTVGSDLGVAITEYASHFSSGAPSQGYCQNTTNKIAPTTISTTGVSFLSDTN